MSSNLFQDIPGHLPDELTAVLVENSGVRIERIVSDGHASPDGFWYDQEENEWVLLVAGSALLSLEKESGIDRVELNPGDHILIPAHQRHRVEATSKNEKTIWLGVFYSS